MSRLITAAAVSVVAIAAAVFFATFPRTSSPYNSHSTEAIETDLSTSVLDWDSDAIEINALSSDLDTLEQKIESAWQTQPAATAPEEPVPETNP